MPKPTGTDEEEILDEEQEELEDEHLQDDSEENEDEEHEEEKEDKEEEDDEDDSDDDDSDEEDDDKGKEKMSRRKSLRFDQLLDKLKDKESAPSKPQGKKDALNYEDELDADEDTVKRLKEDRESYGEELYRRGLEQAKSIQFNTRLELDAPKVHNKYKMLDPDPDNPEFNQTLANTVNRMYLNLVGFDDKTGAVQNADLRYADFVDGLFELGDEMGRKKVEDSKRNITSQARKTAIRPDGSTPKKRLDLTKAPEDMTDEELEAVISAAIPRQKKR